MLALTPAERDRVLLSAVADLARRRLARGLALNVPEATAIVADTVCESARDGARLAEAQAAGAAALRPDQVLPGVADVVQEVAVEAGFDDGTRLVVVPQPFGPPSGRAGAPGRVDVPADASADADGPDGAAVPDGADVVMVTVVNEATVPISVTSHFHFLEANPRLRFDRAAAYGRHLHVPAGDHVRFDPGVPTTVALRPFRGARTVVGFSGLVDGPLDATGMRERALDRLRHCGYLDTGTPSPAGAGAAPPEEAVARLVALLRREEAP